MLSFAAAIAVLIKTRYVAVHGPVSPATVRFIMGERKAVRASFDERSNHLDVTCRLGDRWALMPLIPATSLLTSAWNHSVSSFFNS